MKAESKFNKLRTQAKSKIANLQAELDKFKMDQSATEKMNLVCTRQIDTQVFMDVLLIYIFFICLLVLLFIL